MWSKRTVVLLGIVKEIDADKEKKKEHVLITPFSAVSLKKNGTTHALDFL